MQLIQQTPAGLYCQPGDFYIDPRQSVERAVVTHAHSDHAYSGMKKYLAHPLSAAVMRHRLGSKIAVQELDYGHKIDINGVAVSLHPAGHAPGSSQIRVEYKGQVWVASGDYKVENDGLSTPFEPISCHCFISESTFAMPVFNWEPQKVVFQEVEKWISANRNSGAISLILGYSLGKAQRILANLAPSDLPVFCHKTITETSSVLVKSGLKLPQFETLPMDGLKNIPEGSVVLAPPGARNLILNEAGCEVQTANFSGWMALSKFRKSAGFETGFVLSDHADWKGLLWAIEETGAETVLLNHGFTNSLARYLNENGRLATNINHPIFK